jgi:hypothetical protein
MSADRGAIFNVYKIVASARNSVACNLLSSAYDRVQYLAGIRMEVCRMKLAAERNAQKHCWIFISDQTI